MRIPSGVTDQVIYFVAVDATDLKTRETGLTTFTVYRSRNGGAATATTTPTVTEVDATNMPGVYTLLADEDMTIGAGNDSEEMVYHITQASMAPVTRTIELYRSKITAGETLTVSSGAVSNVTTTATATNLTNLPSIPTNWLTAAGINNGALDGKGDWNIGKTGYTLSQAFPTNFADMAITITTGQVTVGSNNDKTGYSISGAKNTLDDLNDIAATAIVSGGAINTTTGAVDSVTLVDTTTANTDMRGTDSANTVTPDNTSITAILLDTDALQTAHASGNLGANVDKVNGVTITGNGGASPFDVV